MSVDWRGIVLFGIPVMVLLGTLSLRDRYRSRTAAATEGADESTEEGPSIREKSVFRLLANPPLVALTWVVFYFLGNEGSGGTREERLLSARVDGFLWLGPAFFCALVAGNLLQDVYFHWLYGDAYRLPGERGYANQRIAEPTWELVLGACLASFLAWQMHNAYVEFAPDEIRIGPVLAFRERVYSYAEVEAIRVAPRAVVPWGSTVQGRTTMVIEFSDGEDWSTFWHPKSLSRAQVDRLAVYVAERTGKPVQRVEILGRGSR